MNWVLYRLVSIRPRSAADLDPSPGARLEVSTKGGSVDYAEVSLVLWGALQGGAGLVLVLFLLDSLDDLVADSLLLFRRADSVSARDRGRVALERPVALVLAARREPAVLRRYLDHTLNSLRYANYEIFVGVDAHDVETLEQAEKVCERRGHVHVVVCESGAGFDRADCLNWTLQGVRLHEEDRGVRFQIFLLTDAGTRLHADTLGALNEEIPRLDMLQLPVVPEPVSGGAFGAGHLLEEAADLHCRSMTLRSRLQAALPAHEGAIALSRQAVARLMVNADNSVVTVGASAPGYDLGLRVARAGLRQEYRNRWVRRRRIRRKPPIRRPFQDNRGELIAATSPLPISLAASIRGEIRRRLGICLEGWDAFGWWGPASNRYLLWRDRKILLSEPVALLAHGIVLLWLVAGVPVGSPLSGLAAAAAGFAVWRLAIGSRRVALVYGWRQGFKSMPRQLWGLVIRAGASFAAVGAFVRSGRRAGLQRPQPTVEGLRSRRRLLGERLVQQELISEADLARALAEQQRRELPLGMVLQSLGILTERRLLPVLARQLQLALRTVDHEKVSPKALSRLPRHLAIRFSVFPLEVRALGQMLVASGENLTAAERRELEMHLGCRVEICVATRSEVAFAIRRAYPAPGESGQPADRLALKLLESGVVTTEQLTMARARQRESYRRLGDVLLELGSVKGPRLRRAVREFVRGGCRVRFGQFLVDSGAIDRSDLDRGLAVQSAGNLSLEQILLNQGWLTAADLEQARRRE